MKAPSNGRPIRSKTIRGGSQSIKVTFIAPDFPPDHAAHTLPEDTDSYANRYGLLEETPHEYVPPIVEELSEEERLKRAVDAIRGRPHAEVSDERSIEANSREWLKARMERTGSVLDEIDRQRRERGWSERIGGPDKRWDQ